MTGLYVLTSPRRTADDPWDYVRAVISAAKEENLPCAKHLIVDGTADEARTVAALAPGWAVLRYDRPDGQWLGGNKWPYWRLLEIANQLTGAGDDALTLEDDLEFAPNSLTRMLLFPVPEDVSVVQFFSGFLFKQAQMPPGLWRTPAPVQGCQALKYSKKALDLLVKWKESDVEWQKFNASDDALGLAQERLRLRFAHHLPDVIQHIGNVSAVAHGMLRQAGIDDKIEADRCDKTLSDRTSANYVGKHFDCLRLFSRHDLYL